MADARVDSLPEQAQRCAPGQHVLPATAQPGKVTKCQRCRASIRTPKDAAPDVEAPAWVPLPVLAADRPPEQDEALQLPPLVRKHARAVLGAVRDAQAPVAHRGHTLSPHQPHSAKAPCTCRYLCSCKAWVDGPPCDQEV